MKLVEDRDGNPDPVLLSAVVLVALACVVVLVMLSAAVYSAYLRPDHRLDFVELGAGINSTLLGLAAFVGAVAAYWASDGINAKKSAEAKQ